MKFKRSTDILLRLLMYLVSHPEEGHVSTHILSEATLTASKAKTLGIP